MIPIVILAGITLELTILQYSFWPSSHGLMLAIQILYRVITFWAAVQLMKYSLGRREVGPWLMALMLCLIHMDTVITQGHPLETADMVVDTLLGLSLLIIVLEESKAKARRLEVLNRITDAIAKAQECSPMVMAVMLELKIYSEPVRCGFVCSKGTCSDCNSRLASRKNLQKSIAIRIRASGMERRFIRAGSAILLDRANSLPMVREALIRDDLDHILLIPVRGRQR